jgi:hypothetical protein
VGYIDPDKIGQFYPVGLAVASKALAVVLPIIASFLAMTFSGRLRETCLALALWMEEVGRPTTGRDRGSAGT